MKRSDGEGPDNSIGVVVLLDGRSDQTANPNAVTTHLHRSLPSLRIQIGGAHRLAVFFPKVENLTDFDAAIGFESSLIAPWTRIAVNRQSQIRKSGWRKISLLVDFNEVCISLVGAGHSTAHSLHRQVRNDAQFETDGPQKARNDVRRRRDFGFISERDFPGPEYSLELHFVDLMIAAHQGGDKLPCVRLVY